MKMKQSVQKLRYIKFRRQGITQKKTYNIQNTAKVWNQEDGKCKHKPNTEARLWNHFFYMYMS